MPPDVKNLPPLWLSLAKVNGVNQETRKITVKWIGAEFGKEDISVVCPTGNYSLPKIDDVGLVIGTGMRYWWLGGVELEYQKKLGLIKDEKGEKVPFVDKQTGLELLAKKVGEGEVFQANYAKRIWLALLNSGNFALMNGINDGLSYTQDPLRLLKLAGQTVQILGNTVSSAIGSCVRALPAQGNKAIPDESGLSTAPEAFIEVKKTLGVAALKLARLHLGYVRDSLGIDEFGSWGQALGAILEVCQAGLTMAALKMDKIGNVEMTSTSGNMMFDVGPACLMQLGGLTAAQSAVFGENLLAWLNSHTHGTGVGPSGPPITPATSTLLSTKVKLG